MTKHAMTGSNIFGQDRPGPGQTSVEQISERVARGTWSDDFNRSSGFSHALGANWNPGSQRIPVISSKQYIITGIGREWGWWYGTPKRLD